MKRSTFRVILSTLIFGVVIAMSFYLFSHDRDVRRQSDFPQAIDATSVHRVILYYGDGCPHCVAVERYLAQQQIERRFPIEKKEVWRNRGNAQDLRMRARSCGLPEEAIGVPFLWDGQQCIVGDAKIIAFFQHMTQEK